MGDFRSSQCRDDGQGLVSGGVAVRGLAEVAFCARSGITRLHHLRQDWPCRVLFPVLQPDSPPEAVLVNTAGGIVGGDRVKQKLMVRNEAAVSFTTQAAEKVYRSDHAISQVDTEIITGEACQAQWLPQETILFENARLRRATHIHLRQSSTLLAAEITVFGRRTRGERFSSGYLHDQWNVYLERKLIWAARLNLSEGLTAALRSRYAFGNAAAMVLIVCRAPDMRMVRNTARLASSNSIPGGFTHVNGLVIGRFISDNAMHLRTFVAELWVGLRNSAGLTGRFIPRIWEI